MAIQEIHIANYRSIRNLTLPLHSINVLVGPNGCGKSNLYRALSLLVAAAEGRLALTLAEEGGMPSVLWAGPRRKGPVRMMLGVTLDLLGYELSCGLPIPGDTAFILDPEVKEERVWYAKERTKVSLLERENTTVRARDGEGKQVFLPMAVAQQESVLSELREPKQFPVLHTLRQEILSWRFYHHFSTEPHSPLRQPQVGVRTTALHHDGRDLAAALQTIIEIGDGPALHQAIEHAFPGASLTIERTEDARFSVEMAFPGIKRHFKAPELSDGTLQYLCLLAALLSPRPPTLLALNEPETSIHPDLLEPLACLIVRAARFSQLWITTHSSTLAGFIEGHSGTKPVLLEKVEGETRMVRNSTGRDQEEG